MFILQQYYRIGIHCLRTIIYYLYWKSKEPGLGIQGVRFRYPDRGIKLLYAKYCIKITNIQDIQVSPTTINFFLKKVNIFSFFESQF